MLVYNFHKPFSYDALASTASLNAVFDALNFSHLSLHWSSLRTLLLGEARAAHVALLEEQLCTRDPSIAGRVDTWLLSKLKNRAVAVEKTFPPLKNEFLQATGSTDVLLAWLYWKYSNDFLGVGKGLSDTFIEKVFGSASLFIFSPKEQWLEVAIPCPYCAGEAILSSTSARPHADDRLYAYISCSSCGHREATFGHSDERPSSLVCDCARCIGIREKVAQNACQLSAATITSIASEVRNMVKEAVASLTVGSRQVEMSEVGQRFIELANANPSANLVELMQTLMSRQRKYIHPFDFLCGVWKFIPSLVADGLLIAFFDVSELAKDDHELVEITIRGKDSLWHDAMGSESQVHALTTFLLGPKSGAKEHVKSWFKSATDIGLAQSWSILPLSFEFSVNRALLERNALGIDGRFTPETVYIYTNRNRGWTVHGSARLLQIYRDLKAPKGLTRTADVLMATVRDIVSSEMAQMFEAEFLALAPKNTPALNEFKVMVRAQEKLRGIFLSTPVGNALGKYLYWSMCRDVIGEEYGVPLKWIMDVFGCQKAEFSRFIGEVSVPHACPCCGAPGNAINVRATYPNRLDSARYNCHICGHTEVFGIEHANQLTCPCSTCKTERAALLAEANYLAVGITERFVDGASKISEIDNSGDDFGFSVGGLKESLAMSYAQLRLVGKPPHECAHILFEGSIYDSSTFGGEWPVWASKAVKTNLLTPDGVDVLLGDAARRFALESLTILLSEGVKTMAQPPTLADVEKKLISDSGETFAQGIEMMERLLNGGFLLPRRQKCFENVTAILELAKRATENGIEPSHIFKDEYWFKRIKLTMFSARHIPVWITDVEY